MRLTQAYRIAPLLDNAKNRSMIGIMDTELLPRALTYDEKKAAEAAFTGRPFNSEWSEAARKVYDGILSVTGKTETDPVSEDELEPVEPVA